MNYELAKELKDAGFPQEGGFYSGSETVDGSRPKDAVKVPTLEELIEACGVHFRYLDRAKDFRYAHGATNPTGNTVVVDIHTQGVSFNVAVAKLWLALNKKA